MSSAMERWEKENAMHPVGQLADLQTKKKGSSKKSKEENTPLRNQIHALQEQNAAAMIRECEYKALLKECELFITKTDMHVDGYAVRGSLLSKIKEAVA